LTNLAVSIHLPNLTPVTTHHSLGRQTTYVSSQGNFASATELPVAQTTQSWFFLSGVSVATRDYNTEAIVALGDSITDGFNSTVDANRRWPNLLAQRLHAHARFDRDVLAAPGVRFIVLLEGINNIGFPGAFGLAQEAVSAEDIIASY